MSNRSPVPESETASDLAAQIRTILSRLKRRLREQGGRGDLTPSQISVLLRLEKDGAATVSGLARAEGMRPQSMSSIVTSLQDAGLVGSSSDPNDGRQTLMSLSKKCEKLLRGGPRREAGLAHHHNPAKALRPGAAKAIGNSRAS
jgi:DNA-binding MarR family transcriptional regulator